ncbi:alpha-amylase family glycosyl hydrolase [Roseateles violae]|uniref:Alpha-amylase family glycosyl hydrolase n=1 Tax=Roseateles violae TaxID=3058042 RepID=A0ABT8DXG3_9BURK|nr:alpha-amylase family glycosyl hydrolase [Pelomonas sp. PFR6]MDN3921949.1 alpha-amylase family glycosyl hydrolase [Pelomonas sp. PFR6]
MPSVSSQGLAAALLSLVGACHAAGPATSPSPLAPHWAQGTFIEIFVRGYQDSDGDGIGDLRGLTQRLDYLKELGVTGIWLMPITASADHDHGYATSDYRALEPAYGTLADLDELLRQAHARGIGVIADYVVNHAARSHTLFQLAERDRSSPWRDWFVWQDRAPAGWDIWGKNPWTTTAQGSFFATFGPHMPDFNLKNPAVVDYHFDSLRFWLDRGLDGFRLDAVPHLVENNAKDWNDQPESRRLAKRMQDLIKSYPQRHVVCEATANPKVYARPEVCGSAFAFGLEQQVIKAARGEAASVKAVAEYFKTAPPTMATMLSNHDIFAGERVWDQLKGNEARYKLAAATYLLQPGIPFIYYGEEIGMAGIAGLPGDEPLRAPMSWGTDIQGFTSADRPFRPLAPNAATHNAAAEAQDPASILNFYKAMLQLRKSRPSIARGSYPAAQAEGQTLVFQRLLGRERSLIAINYGAGEKTLTAAQLPTHAKLRALYPAPSTATPNADAAGRVSLTLPPLSVLVFDVQ